MAGATPAANIGGATTGSSSSSNSGGFSLFGGGSGAPNSGRPGGNPGTSSPGGGFGMSTGNANGNGISSNASGVANASDISKQLGGNASPGSLPIVGVASTSDKESLKEMDGKNKYSEWEFTYDPTLDATRGITAVPQQNSGIGGDNRALARNPNPARQRLTAVCPNEKRQQ